MNVQAARQVDEAGIIVGELRLQHFVGNVRAAQVEPREEGEHRDQCREGDGEESQGSLRARSRGEPASRRLGLKDIPFSLAKGLDSRKKRHYHDL
jgi:hypothetical protein